MFQNLHGCKISFTGSIATGKRIAAAAASDLKRLTVDRRGVPMPIGVLNLDLPDEGGVNPLRLFTLMGIRKRPRRCFPPLGHRHTNGAWRHPERHAIWLGDFIDRGPQQLEMIAIARNMVEAGSGSAVMDNHEYNSIGWATKDPEDAGGYLRPHNSRNRHQHAAFLDAVGEGSEVHRDAIDILRPIGKPRARREI